MTTVNLLDQIIQPGDDRRRRRCMNESGWIAFSTGRDQQLPRRTRVSCRAHQRRPLVPSAAGEARAGHALAATAPGIRWLVTSCCGLWTPSSIARSQSVSVWFGDQETNSDHVLRHCFCLPGDRARLLRSMRIHKNF